MGDAIAILTHAAKVAKEIEEEILRTGAWHDVEVWGWTDVCRTLREKRKIWGANFFSQHLSVRITSALARVPWSADGFPAVRGGISHWFKLKSAVLLLGCTSGKF